MSYAAIIELIYEVPEARNQTEAELYGRQIADRIRQNAEDVLIDCKLTDAIEYEVDE